MTARRKCPECGQSEQFDETGRCRSCGAASEITDTGEGAGTLQRTGRVLGDSASFLAAATKRAPAGIVAVVLILIGLAVWNPLNRLHRGTMTGDSPKIDVVFAIDCTGSMADEIEAVKDNVKKMIANLQSGQPRPEVRFGIVAYRDRGDEFVTRKYPLTGNIDEITADVSNLRADGGGDTPESVNEALHVAVEEMNWGLDQRTTRMLFLIGDAAPHEDYEKDFDYRTEVQAARKKGIKVYALGCSGIDDSGIDEFREIASLGGGKFDYLTYREQYADESGKTFDVLRRGAKTYVAKPDAHPTAWRSMGADGLADKKMAEELPAAPSMGGAAMTAIPGYAAKATRSSAKLENNLPDLMEGEVKREVESKGAVRY